MGSTVVLLGLVSLLTDLSSEMVAVILPLFLVSGLGLSPLQYGVVDGLYQGVSAAVRIIGGAVADLTRRPKLVAVAGYGLSAVCKLAMLPASTFAAVSTVVAIDRTGKGIRTAPRDAMIAAATAPGAYGMAFGVHRAMDTIGAMGGPLVAFAVLASLPQGYDAIFLISFAVALLGVGVLVIAVPDERPAKPAAAKPAATKPAAAKPAAPKPAEPAKPAAPKRPMLSAVRPLLARAEIAKLVAAAGLLAVVTIGDGFVYLSLQEEAAVSNKLFPLLFVGTSLVYFALAIPLGALADRLGRRWIFLGGHLVLAGVYLTLLADLPGWLLVGAVLALLGTYYACTDGVLSALAAPLLPPQVRATGMSLVQTAVAGGRLLAAVGFGWVWTSIGRHEGLLAYGGAIVVATVLAWWLLRDAERRGRETAVGSVATAG